MGETLESRIKYHRNWIYDTQLVPGRIYQWNADQKRFILSKRKSAGLKIPSPVVTVLERYKGLLPIFQSDFTQAIPEMPIVSCDIETEYEKNQIPQASDPRHRITCICFADNSGRSIALVLKREGVDIGEQISENSQNLEIMHFDDESSLLKRTFEILNQYPICLTFNGDNFDFPYIHERARVFKLNHLSPIIWNRRNKECCNGIF